MASRSARTQPTAFLVMPFTKALQGLRDTIVDVAEVAGLQCVRADEIPHGGSAVNNIYTQIDQAAIVIGVTSGANFNVGLELGYAHGHNSESILLTDDPNSLPFDVQHINHLVYDLEDLAGLSDKLAKWIDESDYAYEASQHPILYRGDILENVVDGTFYLQRTRPMPSKHEIKALLGPNARMPQRLLYLTEDGQTAYLNLCDDPKYVYYQETTQYIVANASSIVDSVLKHCGSAEVDFISIGPGNGRKDAIFLEEFLGRTRQLKHTYYYPYDVSGGLLLEAMRNILAGDLSLSELRVKAIEADVAALKAFKPVFDFRREPNVYSLLGGLSNMTTEVDLLNLLYEVMNPEDCLLLEVRKKAATHVTGLGTPKLNRELDLAPLRYVGASVKASKVEYKEVVTTSVIPDTRTVAAKVDKIEFDDRTYKDVSLFPVHYYEPDAIKGVLTGVGFEILEQEESQPNSLFYICARR